MPSDSPPPDIRRNRSRSGSRSPPRRERPRKRGGGGGGFRWKEKPSRAVFEEEREREAGGDHLQRGYRSNRSPPRRDDRDRDRFDARGRRDRDRGDGEYRRRSRSPRGGDRDRRDRDGERDHYRPRERSPAHRERRRDDRREREKDEALEVASKFGMASGPDRPAGVDGKKKDKNKVEQKIAPTTEPMIIVTVNDRLGTKAQIPCLASDPIKLFKAQVAARIGRQPHEIMLKRQGERPFKDQLSLEDYGVSNGVQLDLELDTGD